MGIERNAAIKLARQGKYQEALSLLERAYQKGDFEALSDIGVIYERLNDYETALTCYSKASMVGCAVATYNAANLYMLGKGAKEDDYLAFLLFTKASKEKYSQAFFKLSYFYENGVVVNKDEKKAFKLVKEGIKYKENEACLTTLGYYYETGTGIKQNDKKALKYYLKASTLGVGTAMHNAALYYLYKNKKKDIKKGTQLLLDASNVGYPDAYAEIAKLYRNGILGKKDEVASNIWHCLALDKRSWKALLMFAEDCLSGENENHKVELEAAASAISMYLAKSGEYKEDYRHQYEQIKETYADLLDWEDIENNPELYIQENEETQIY